MRINRVQSAACRAALPLAVVVFTFLQSQPVAAQTSPATLPDLKLSTAGNVRAVFAQPDGKIIITGVFSSVNDVFPGPGVARLNPNGSLDISLNFLNAAGLVQSNGTTVTRVIPISVVGVSETHLYFSGFRTILPPPPPPGPPFQSGVFRSKILDGSLDQDWVFTRNDISPAILNGPLTVDGTNVYLGGSFAVSNSAGVLRTNLARVSVDGSGAFDTNWNATVNGEVQRITVAGTNVFVAGKFSTPTPQVAKFSTITGEADLSWHPGFSVSTQDIRSLVVSGDSLYIAGDFTNVDSFARDGLVKVSVSGTGAVDPDWNPPRPTNSYNHVIAVANNATFISGLSDGQPFLLKADAAGTGAVDAVWGQNARFDDAANAGTTNNTLLATASGIFLGGNFVQVSGAVSLGLAKVDPVSGLRDGSFPVQVQGVGATVNAIARQPDGKVIVGGLFQIAGGLARRNLARVNPDGRIDSTWIPNTDGPVYALALDGTNIFVGGQFRRAGGLSRTNLAKIATAGSDAADAVWDARIAYYNFDGTILDKVGGAVYALAVVGTNLFVGGYSLGTYNYAVALGGIAKFSTVGAGTLDVTWNPHGEDFTLPFTGTVYALASSGNDLFLGGNFNKIGGVSRFQLAKVSTLSTGGVDLAWNAFIQPPGFGSDYDIRSLVVDGTNLYAGGHFRTVVGAAHTNLARFSTIGTGAVDVAWSPIFAASGGVRAIAVSGTNVYAGGDFPGASTPYGKYLAKFSSIGAGAVDPSYPFASNTVAAIAANGSDVYVGGSFSGIASASRAGFAFLPIADAPQLIQDTQTNLFMLRNAMDGPEVTHFRITTVSGGTLFKSDGVMAVNAGDFITVADGNAGLKFASEGTVTAVSALNNTTNGAGTAASSLTMATNPAPTFKFTSDTYSVREGQGNITVIVRKFGNGAASVDFATSDLTATGSLDYQTRSGTLNFSAADKFKNILITIADDLQAEGDEQFAVTMTNAGGGASIAGPASAIVTITDNDLGGASDSVTTAVLPTAPPVSSGALTVSLQPTNANGQWRLLGELNWHDGGFVELGLVTGNFGIEFRPVNGYREPQSLTIPISSGATNQFTFFYAAITNLEAGNLSVLIQPNDVASAADATMRGQWRRQGTTNWLNSGDVIPNLNAGNYALEFKTVPGRVAPPTQLIAVGPNATYSTIGTYAFDSAPGALTPTVVPFGTATTNEPYLYNGQIQTSVGFGSGFVVKQRVALTAAHVLFDDVQLSYVTTVRWFFQRYRDQLEPVPQTPRGWYVFEGYATQRQLDNSPGISTPASQNLDVAAMYFLENAGRGGFGGYLSSDADNNEFLLSANNKFLAGYPLDGVATDADKGKLFATTPANLTFTRLYTSIFSTTNVASFPGNSGGPLYVQSDVNQYLPAAIYLGGSGATLVRAINSEVVDLINRAEVSGNGGGNSTGGGATLLSPGQTASAIGTGILNVSLKPSNAVNIRPGWRIAGLTDTNYFDETAFTTVAVIGGGNYPIEFKPIPGFITPSNRTVTIAVGGLVTIQADYVGIRPQLTLNRTNGLTLSGGGTGGTYRVEFATNFPQAVWTPLTSFTLSNSSLLLPSTIPPISGNRFYRAVLVP